MTSLQERARHCIITLLEIAPAVGIRFRESFCSDFTQLRGYLARIEDMSLAEDDVRRLENLTQNFLKEAARFCVRNANRSRQQ